MENVKNIKNPWLGLKTYEEGQILYGRTDDINTLSQNILFNIQTVIYGKSGIGKSSILNAGVFPILRRSNFFPVNIRLVHNQPERSYNSQIWECVMNSLSNLRKEILTSDGTYETIKDIQGRHEELAPKSEKESLWEMFHRNVFYNDEGERIQPVLVFDQFEEIFTREKDQDKVVDFFNELADLINNVVPSYLCADDKKEQDNANDAVDLNDDVLLDEEFDAVFANYLMDSNFHVVLSLREDFLSYLERNIANIPLLKHNRYCLKPLSEEQAASVIMEPSPGLVSEDVAKEIISKVTGVPTAEFELGDDAELEVDSAILSLFLSELYERKPVESRTIDKSLVVELGDNIIQDFYERTISNISEDCAEYLEYKLITDDGRRDSVFESHVIQRKGYKASDLEYLKKQRLIREFPWNDGIRIEFIHDVLCPIIVHRKEERRQIKLRQEEAKAQEIERQRVLLEAQKKEERLKKKNRNILIVSIGTFLSAVLVLLMYLYCYVWDYKEYYSSLVWRYEMPYGINKLSPRERKYTSVFLEFSKKGRLGKHWKTMRALNSTMNLTTDAAKGTLLVPTYDEEEDGKVNSELKGRLKEHCIWEFVTDQSGETPLQVKFYDRRHKLICCFSMVCHHDENGKIRYVVGQFTDEYGQPILSRKNGASVVKITLDDEGFRSFIEYFDSWGNRARNYNNALAQRYEHSHHPDSLGLEMRNGSADASGEYVYDKVGNSGMKSIYVKRKGKWLLTHAISVDPKGNICPVNSGYSIIVFEYDEIGRQIRKSYFDAEHNPAVDLKDNNTHSYSYVYDDYGNITEIYNYGIDGELKREGLACRKIKIDPINSCQLEYAQYDCRGNLFENSRYCMEYGDKKNPDKRTVYYNLDIEGNISRDYEGVFVSKYDYDNEGNNISETYYDRDGTTPMLCDKGYFGIRRVYENDKLVELYYINREGALTSSTNGYAKKEYSYDSKGNIIAETFIDSNGDKCEIDGYCSILYKYDVFNNLIQKNWKNIDGKNSSRYVVKKYKYDYWGNLLEDANFNDDETSRTENNDNIHRICYEYDSLFYVCEERYYNMFNELTGCPNDTTYSIVRYENDEYGNSVSKAYFNEDYEPCDCAEGYHKIVRTFNSYGYVLSERYYNSDGGRVKHSNGCWEERVVYDKSFITNYASISEHDMHGNLMNTTNGWAFKTYKYDDLGNAIEIAYFDKDSIPTMNDNEFHKVISTFDGTNAVRREYYDDENKLLTKNSVIVYEYDDYDYLTSMAYYNGDGSNGECSNGWHRVKRLFDDKSRLVEVFYVDADERPVDVEVSEYHSGYRIKYVYDDRMGKTTWFYKVNGDSICDGYASSISLGYGIYSGYLKEGVPHGKGKFSHYRGWSYEGDWKYGKFSGTGKYTFEDGGYYVGDFKSGDFNGWGSRYTDKDSLLVSGRFYEDEFMGPILITVRDVVPNSFASSQGVCIGDIIIEWNEFNYFKGGKKFNDINVLAEEFGNSSTSSREKEKRVKVVRIEKGRYFMKDFSFPPGVAGVASTGRLSSIEEINKLYEMCVNDKNQTDWLDAQNM